MPLLKRKPGTVFAPLLAAIFSLNVAAVDNPVSYITEINDCDVIKYNGEYYIQGNWLKGDMLTSRDLESWGERTHVFSWNNTWHTQVNQTDPDYDIHGTHLRYSNGTFHLYAHLEALGDGITHATSANIWGSYTEPVNSPFAVHIDPDSFMDDNGNLYFYTTKFGSGQERVYVLTMSNPSTLTSGYIEQITSTDTWYGGTNINEASKVFKYRGRYYMLYNAYGTTDPNYSIGCVEASGPTSFSNSGKYPTPICTRVTPAAGKPEINTIGQPWMVEGLNGFEKWIGYFAITSTDGRTQRIDRMHFFYRTLFVDGPTDRYSTGYHPSPAQPEYLGIFNAADGSFPSDWTLQTGAWNINSEELRQTTATGFHNVILNRDPAENLLAEANIKLIGGASTRAGLTVVKDGTDWLRVGFDQMANRWFYERMNDSVYDTGNYALPAGFDYQSYHKIQLCKDGNTVHIEIDDIPSPTLSSLSVNFDGAALPELFTDGAQAAFDGVIYTIGWDEFDSGVDGWGDSIHGLPFVGSRTYGSGGITVNSGFVYKGDLMPEYEFSAQAYQVSGTGSMGLAAVAIDNNNYLNAVINLATDKLVVSGVHGGVGFSEPEVSVANKTDYNLRVAKLADRVIFFVDGVEKLTVHKAYGASPVGLIATGMNARFNGIMAYRTKPTTLPSPWTSTDIGSVAFAGGAKHHEDWFTVRGSGSGVWGQSNEFQFTHRSLSGDGEIVAQMRVAASKGYWARMGLMIRESTSPDSKFIMMNMNGQNNFIQQIWHEVDTSHASGYGVIDYNGSFDVPQWLKISRSGNVFNCYRSNDGTNWTLHGTRTISMGANVLIGMAVMDSGTTFISKAVFDNVSVTVPLNPGIIGNSQEIYEDEDPAAFTSVEGATGSGAVAYQWQQTLTPGDGGSWADIAGAANETYAFPNQNGVYPTDTELFARRKATDAYSVDYSNQVSLKLKKVFDTSGDYLFIDNFNTINTGDVNWDYATRQAAGGGTSTYTDPVNHFSISNNKLKNEGWAGLLTLDASMERYLVGEDFELSFKLAVPDTSGLWSSIYLADTLVGRETSHFGLVAFGGGSANAFELYKGISGNRQADVISVADMTTLLESPYDKATEHTIQLVSRQAAAGTNTCDFMVDGVLIRRVEYAFNNNDLRLLELTGVLVEGGAFYDDISLRHSRTYAKWVEDNNLVGVDALRTTDIEPDGLDNLAEYALGGNPTSNDAAAFMPTFAITNVGSGSNVMDYVYNRRLNAASLGLTYGLNTSTNLLGAWEYVGTDHETDSVAIDQDFESVTNSVPFGTDEGFVQLEVSGE